MENKTLSVIVPVYNTKEYLPRCLDSIINQTYTDLEIICVDDGSTDGSDKLLEEYAKKDNRITVIHKDNGGLVSARKSGISKASGLYTAYVDSDDWIEPEMYENMVHVMMRHDVDMVASGFIRDYGSHFFVDNEKKPGFYSDYNLEAEIKCKLVDFDYPFKFVISPSLCNKVFKTEMLRRLQLMVPNEVSIDEDTACTYPYIIQAHSVYVMDKSFYHYCQRLDSMLNSSIVHADQQNTAINRVYDYLSEMIDNRTSNYLKLYAKLNVCPEYILSYDDGVLLPYCDLGSSKKIVLYGYSAFGRKLNDWIIQNTDLSIVAFGDKNGDGVNILNCDQIKKLEYDFLLICSLLSDVSNSIKTDLIRAGISSEHIRFIDINSIMEEWNNVEPT